MAQQKQRKSKENIMSVGFGKEDFDIVVKGMRMPWNCFDCPLFLDMDRQGHYCRALKQQVDANYAYRPTCCPLRMILSEEKRKEEAKRNGKKKKKDSDEESLPFA